MADLPAVAGCLPGAVLTEVAGEKGGTVRGHIAIKFGPNSKAAGDIAYQLKALSAHETEVAVDLQYSLQGPLAQFSRSGLVRDFVRRMIADFGKSVARRMGPDAERCRTQPGGTPQSRGDVLRRAVGAGQTVVRRPLNTPAGLSHPCPRQPGCTTTSSAVAVVLPPLEIACATSAA